MIGAEDCLNLNIYVPAIESSKLLPVIVWIHGGAFQWHMEYYNGQFTKPDYLMDRDVILVTFSYRLGPLGSFSFSINLTVLFSIDEFILNEYFFHNSGFLSTGDEIVPGNMGLKDQNMALRWVKANIKSFNGNPEEITLTGLSAGGASVHYHYLSPLSVGLFKSKYFFSL